MESRPDGLEDDEVAAALVEGWAFDVTSLEYAPVGFGSHHWIAVDAAGSRRFVTVDELARHGVTADQVLGRLRPAFDTALCLRRDAGLDFVVAPLPARDRTTVRRLHEDFSIAVFPWVDGETREFGAALPETERTEVLSMLDALHRAVPPSSIALDPVDQPMVCATVEDALAAVAQPWSGGPFAEPARAWLRDHAAAVRALVDEIRALAAAVVARDAPLVVTHGEPHPRNVVRTAGGPVLVDWDTVALAPPARDLWFVPEGVPETEADALELYRQVWTLKDLAAYVDVFRRPHGRNPNTEKTWAGLSSTQLDSPA
jgi:spectinomycin phosphotransferase